MPLEVAVKLPIPVRAESPIYSSTRRRRGRSRSRARCIRRAMCRWSVRHRCSHRSGVLGVAAGARRRDSGGGCRRGRAFEGRRSGEARRQVRQVAATPLTFTAGDGSSCLPRISLRSSLTGAAVAAAGRAGDGFGPIRGLRRLRTRFFGAEVLPRLAVSSSALEFALDGIATQVDRTPRSAALVLHGLRVETVSERAGARLERDAAAEVIVRAWDGSTARVFRLPSSLLPPPRP